jgi:DNA-binding NarL/FixJ family response regulator
MALRCIIVDDNSRFLELARGLLEGEVIEVVAVASTSAAALAHAGELRPDVAIVDVDLGEESGLELARRLADPTGAHGIRVVLMSAHGEDYAELVSAYAAVGFVSKSRLSATAIAQALAEGRPDA